jgi:hypothetical protein
MRRPAILAPSRHEVVENIDVSASARDDHLHLLRWMR